MGQDKPMSKSGRTCQSVTTQNVRNQIFFTDDLMKFIMLSSTIDIIFVVLTRLKICNMPANFIKRRRAKFTFTFNNAHSLHYSDSQLALIRMTPFYYSQQLKSSGFTSLIFAMSVTSKYLLYPTNTLFCVTLKKLKNQC